MDCGVRNVEGGIGACYPSNTFCGPIQGDMRAKSKVHRPEAEVCSLRFKVRGSRFSPHRPSDRRPAAVGYLSRFLCAGLALTLLAPGCAGPRALKGGKTVMTRNPAGAVEQTLVQGENPSQASKQDQEIILCASHPRGDGPTRLLGMWCRFFGGRLC